MQFISVGAADKLKALQTAERTLMRSSDLTRGSIRAQLVKLGCSQAISTPYYLVTDADLFFMRKVQALDLVLQSECKDTSGVCDLKQKVHPRLPHHNLLIELVSEGGLRIAPLATPHFSSVSTSTYKLNSLDSWAEHFGQLLTLSKTRFQSICSQLARCAAAKQMLLACIPALCI